MSGRRVELLFLRGNIDGFRACGLVLLTTKKAEGGGFLWLFLNYLFFRGLPIKLRSSLLEKVKIIFGRVLRFIFDLRGRLRQLRYTCKIGNATVKAKTLGWSSRCTFRFTGRFNVSSLGVGEGLEYV